MSSLNNEHIEQWKSYLAQERADSEYMAERASIEEHRTRLRPEVQAFIYDFLDCRTSIEDFRAIFDSKTRRDWNYGVSGMSGAMVLNILVKYLPDQGVVASELRKVIKEPTDVNEARKALQGFHDFLLGYIASGVVARNRLQLARIPFFVSFFWYIQSQRNWPVYYLATRQALIQGKLFRQTTDPVADYFTFYELFPKLASALGLDNDELGTLCLWITERKNSQGDHSNSSLITKLPIEEEGSATATVTHTQIQWLLAKIGMKFGLRVWIAVNDQGKEWQGQRLGDFSVKSLPSLGMDPETQRIISLIDVVWLKGTNQVVGAFEVEHTTSIYSGLLRMSDLVVLSPNLNFPLYIVTPASRMPDVRRQLSRPTFQALELNRRCGFFSGEDLLKEAESILRWASDPSSIDRLVSRVGDVVGVESRE